ncbi:hypothetical protein FQN49_003041 [Arthroderma sp. PD_2]|nr:hypothetical protein FQN49_003041 [Arthroderma sp. PD_2]
MSGVAEDGACDSRTASVGLAPAKDVQQTSSQTAAPGKKLSANWNNVRKGKVRTVLRRAAPNAVKTTNSFNTVNGKYWRSGSASAEDESEAETRAEDHNSLAKDASDADSDNSTDDSTDPSDVDENDSSILLNMDQASPEESVNPEPQPTCIEQKQSPVAIDASKAEIQGQPASVEVEVIQYDANNADIDAAAREAFSSKYTNPPQTIAELSAEDFKKQSRYILYNTAKDPDPTTAVRCTDCFKEGHLSDICPSKKCEHCGAWDVHESRFCPTWRRCQKCRERGHDKETCSAALQGSAEEVPCDLCGSDQHIESQCDLMWKLPQGTFNSGKLFISISCAQCTSPQHLIGDCPSIRSPSYSTSWSLKAFDPSIISNINQLPVSTGSSGTNGALPQLKIKGRAHREPTPEEDEFHIKSRPNPPPAPRSHIRFADGLGRGRNLGSNANRSNDNGGDHYTPRDSRDPRDSRRDYRERDQFFGSNSRPRSRSPDSRYSGNQYRPQPPPSRGRGPPPPSRGSGRGRGRGGGGGGQRGGKDTSRPMSGRGKRKNNRNS